MGMIGDAIGSYTRAAMFGKTAHHGRTDRAKSENKPQKTDKTEQTAAPEATESTGKISGRTIGDPKLSDKASKLYDELREKYGDMEFVLVSNSKKDAVEANAAAYGKPGKTVVLISEEKLEKMAGDDNYRKQVEGTIDKAKDQIEQAKAQIASSPLGSSLKTIGIKVNENGETSFFAQVDKNRQSADRIAEKRAEKKKEAKAAEKKKAEKHEKHERLEKMRAKNAERKEKPEHEEDIEEFESDTIEGLIKKLEDFSYSRLSDSVMTKEEAAIGGSIDFRG